ncbi:MAG TPA: ATP-binding protein [Xanthobacteraceae bacterium]|nr:ATP-binding protein [Xanthobacteraceae bacterium]
MSEAPAEDPADKSSIAAGSGPPPRGKSELARLIRNFDWASTSLGPQQRWPKSLQTAVAIMLASRQPIWIGWGADLIYLYNDPYKSIIGGKHPWALGKPTSVVWREIWQDISPLLSQAMGGDEGTYVEAQLLIMERNGYPEETHYTFSYSPIPDDDGRVGGIFCANTDDTQRVIGERQLALLRELAATTAEARTWQQACERCAGALASDPHDLPFAMIYILAADGRTATLASAAGIDRDHPALMPSLPLDGDHAWPLADVHADRQARVVTDLEAAFQATFPRGPWQQAPNAAVVLPIISSGETGHEGFLIAGLNPFRLFDANYAGFMTLVAGQIAAAIANAEAYEQERRRAEALAELDHAKTAFFSNVSHEFRTPLTLMLGPLEDALRDGDDLPLQRREEITVAHRNALRLLRLVNTLLDFSRVEAGRMQPQFENTDLAAATREMAANFASVCERANLTLQIDCEPNLPGVDVDRQMWEKIVLNLISNAFKFTFAGGIAVRLGARDGRVALTVRDTGVGIPASELPHVFERFHRVEGQRGRTYEGSGIGLALVRELVALHGGEVGVESEVGRGTAFTVVIPYRQQSLAGYAPDGRQRPPMAPQEPEATRATAYVEEAFRWLPADATHTATADILPDAAATPSGGAGRQPRVLIADDNADMRDYVRRLLAPHYAVETVSNGVDALAAIRREKPELLLTDVMMPLCDGFALLQQIRADNTLSDLPVILLSARAGDEAKVEGLGAGADDYLTKPFSARELLARIATNIAMAKMRRETAAELEAQKTQLQTVLATVPAAVWFTYDADVRTVIRNRRAAELLRMPLAANVALSTSGRNRPEHFRFYQNGSEVPVGQLPLRRAVRDEAFGNEEFEIRFSDGSSIALLVQAAPLRNAAGAIVGGVCAALDISERKRVEDHRLLLLNELNHRVKNTLATVQSIAAQSFRGPQSGESARALFEARLMALSRVHDVLTEENWQGANLDEIVGQAIMPYKGGDPNRFQVTGPSVRLSARMALSISMALHELATNAAKYGALSDGKGSVRIAWHVERQEPHSLLQLEWRESGGPAVTPPVHKGFGSRLIERGLAQDLGGGTTMEFRPEGLRCAITTRIDERS